MPVLTRCVLVLFLTACSGGSSADSVPPPSVGDSGPTTSTTLAPSTTVAEGSASSSSTTTAPDPTGVSTLAQYLAAVEGGLEGTEMEGAAFEEPASLVDTGVLFCELLDEGFSPVDVLRGWVAALSTDESTPSEDDLRLGGVVLGAAVKFICPEYLDDLQP